ncbi:MAG: enoyl-CoA hydratase/isomerase family protein [Chloroflexi bacterium]|nr:enoyl-CoA hydratase/isomerase family protein [Chloroflexota bacterium]MDA1239840.1 enoyl-CoA hydratase/isomerase family protein [Chloroflexota bacterium]
MGYEALTFERRGQVALVTLNRPEMMNALNKQLQEDTRAACAEVEADDSLRVMVVTGNGRAFCAGADLGGSVDARQASDGEAPQGAPPQDQRLDEYGWIGRQAMAFYRMTKPTIAAVNGAAVGAGMSLALACDLRVGCPDTRMRTTFIERNLSPDSGMSWFLPRIVGYARAVDLMFTSRDIRGEEAFTLGLVDRFVPSDRLVDEAMTFAEQIAKWPPLAMRATKRTMQRNLMVDLEEALRNETTGHVFSRRAPNDALESRRSFFERRPPVFTGE